MKPLAKSTLAFVFNVISEKLSENSIRLLKNNNKIGVTAHDLRHTAAVVRLARYRASGHDLETAVGKLRVFFGWSKTSSMPQHYASAYFETTLAEVWNDEFDCFVDTLRSMKGIER